MNELNGFNEATISIFMHLPPRFINNIQAGVETYLNQSLMKYVPEVEGVIVAYRGVKYFDKYARILNEYPELHFYISTKVLVFSPKIGTNLIGVVNQVGVDHVGLLVYGLFNGSIGATNIPTEFVHDEPQSRWRSTRDPELFISIGQQLRFHLIAINVSKGMVVLIGSLMSPETGPILRSSNPVSIDKSNGQEEKKKKKVASLQSGAKKKKKDDSLQSGAKKKRKKVNRKRTLPNLKKNST